MMDLLQYWLNAGSGLMPQPGSWNLIDADAE